MTNNRYLLVDLEAVQYLEQESTIEEYALEVKGYEAYLVEQWACSRRENAVVCSYTGNDANTVQVAVLSLPDRAQWGPKTQQFMEEMKRNHLLEKESSQGRMFIANLGSFPSNKTLIPIPTSFQQGFPLFIVNENLKRLACMGRLPVSLHAPTDATRLTFYDHFKVPVEIPLRFAVREVVTLLQISLFYCGMLRGEYVDGFYCDFTIKAAQEWWKVFGEVGKHGPIPSINQKQFATMTIAAVVGFVFSCVHRLSLLGYKPPKDCFSVHMFLNCIHLFQKSERLDRTDRLDPSTVHRLRDLTAKHIRGSDVISSLKSTVKENLQGKIQAQINDYETADIAVLANQVKGGRAKYLWKCSGHQFTPISSFTSDEYDSVTGIPLNSLAEDGSEPRLLKTPRQKGSQKAAARNLLRKRHNNSSKSVDLLGQHLQADMSVVSLNNSGSILSYGPSDSDPKLEQPPQPPNGSSPQVKITDTMLLTKDDLALLTKRPHKKRTQSFSDVQDVVFRWSFPASIARVSQLYSHAVNLHNKFVSHINEAASTQQKLRERLAFQQAEITTENRYSDNINYRIIQSKRKEQTVKQQIHNLESITDKLDYQWAYLVKQVEQVEKAVDNFHVKVEESQRRWRVVSGMHRS